MSAKNIDIVLDSLKDGSFKDWNIEEQREALQLKEDDNDPYSASILDFIVDNGLVSKIPKDILDDKNIVFRDGSGDVLNGLLHMCATDEQWRDIPKRLLTEKNLLVPNFWGNTPIHEAANQGSYNFIIENLDILSEKTFVEISRDNDTALELLISTKTGSNTERPPLKNKETILSKVLKKFNHESLKSFYNDRIKDNPLIDPDDKQIFKKHLAIPVIKKLAQSEQHLEI
jgi:hypothetical protein